LRRVIEQRYINVTAVERGRGIVERVHLDSVDAEPGGQVERALQGVERLPSTGQGGAVVLLAERFVQSATAGLVAGGGDLEGQGQGT
jgi:hypothetical protein